MSASFIHLDKDNDLTSSVLSGLLPLGNIDLDYENKFLFGADTSSNITIGNTNIKELGIVSENLNISGNIVLTQNINVKDTINVGNSITIDDIVINKDKATKMVQWASIPYTSNAGKALTVNATGTNIEYVNISINNEFSSVGDMINTFGDHMNTDYGHGSVGVVLDGTSYNEWIKMVKNTNVWYALRYSMNLVHRDLNITSAKYLITDSPSPSLTDYSSGTIINEGPANEIELDAGNGKRYIHFNIVIQDEILPKFVFTPSSFIQKGNGDSDYKGSITSSTVEGDTFNTYTWDHYIEYTQTDSTQYATTETYQIEIVDHGRLNLMKVFNFEIVGEPPLPYATLTNDSSTIKTHLLKQMPPTEYFAIESVQYPGYFLKIFTTSGQLWGWPTDGFVNNEQLHYTERFRFVQTDISNLDDHYKFFRKAPPSESIDSGRIFSKIDVYPAARPAPFHSSGNYPEQGIAYVWAYNGVGHLIGSANDSNDKFYIDIDGKVGTDGTWHNIPSSIGLIQVVTYNGNKYMGFPKNYENVNSFNTTTGSHNTIPVECQFKILKLPIEVTVTMDAFPGQIDNASNNRYNGHTWDTGGGPYPILSSTSLHLVTTNGTPGPFTDSDPNALIGGFWNDSRVWALKTGSGKYFENYDLTRFFSISSNWGGNFNPYPNPNPNSTTSILTISNLSPGKTLRFFHVNYNNISFSGHHSPVTSVSTTNAVDWMGSGATGNFILEYIELGNGQHAITIMGYGIGFGYMADPPN